MILLPFPTLLFWLLSFNSSSFFPSCTDFGTEFIFHFPKTENPIKKTSHSLNFNIVQLKKKMETAWARRGKHCLQVHTYTCLEILNSYMFEVCFFFTFCSFSNETLLCKGISRLKFLSRKYDPSLGPNCNNERRNLLK